MRPLPLLACLCLASGVAAAECPPDSQAVAATIAEAWRARETIAAPAVADDAAARCAQDALAALLAGPAGAPIGWKVGLTSPAAQQQFGVDHPVAGVLFERMLLEDGARVPRGFGGRGVVEADLIVTVRDAAIMEATTPAEVLAHLDGFVPFIELADLMVTPGQPLSAEIITAINVGARAGVTGAPLPIAASDEWEAALAAMTVRIEDASGATLGEYPGAAILGHPLNAVLWLTERLRATGGALRPGDRISLGSFGPPIPAAEATDLVVRYLGLPDGAEASVSVRFE